MHEMAIAQSLVDMISQEALRRHAKPIRAKISCGELNAINDDVLSFACEAVAQGTPCEGIRLQIEHKPLQARCRTCGTTFAIDSSSARCPSCNGEDFELLADAPLLLEEIEFEEGLSDEEGGCPQEDPECQ